MNDTLVCSECGAKEDDESEDAPLVFGCSHCGVVTCDNCGSGGMCASCDVDDMAGIDEDDEGDEDEDEEE